MNAQGRADILLNRPIHYASQSSHDATPATVFQNHQALVYTLLALISAYVVADHFGLAPVSLIQFLWNILVYLTPARVLVALDSRMSPADSDPSNPSQMTMHAKSESMQRILGLDNNSFPFIPRPRALSGIGSVFLGNNKEAIPRGLGNWDNSCYQNSIIQGLASLKSLSYFLRQNVDELAENSSLSTHEALRGIIDLLNSASKYGQKLWIPPELKSMSSWQQQDAQEYFSKVVDQIDIEIRRASKGQTRNLGLKMAGPQENILGSLDQNSTTNDGKSNANSTSETASLRNPLEGLLAQRVGCTKCGWTEGLSLIPFNCLTVPLGSKFEYEVGECLDDYMALEEIEGVECAKCTLLRAQQQLKNLLGDILGGDGFSDRPESPGLSDAVVTSAQARLEAVNTALEGHDFAEKTLTEKCHIPSKNRVSSIKSRQAVIARAPQCLVVHINRSLFDEMTGMLKKNYAGVNFPRTMNLNNWCLGVRSTGQTGESHEQWVTDPRESMLPRAGEAVDVPSRQYELRAIITHYGRHENGHYVCYRKYSTAEFPAPVPDEVLQAEGDKEKAERWYRLSDDDVQMVSEGHVMSQGGVFMLFYEAIEQNLSARPEEPLGTETVLNEPTESVSNFTEDMSTTSTVADAESSTSRATSVSASDQPSLPVENSKSPIPPLKTSGVVNINTQDSGGDTIGSPTFITAS
ncbi:hypothetical protein N7532_005697 [Penicillium argentinense]|uniref:ubiquitinyl hydrolase 1 n=1 Tax=Penicillium argentinense TaxID=1131581 RepID=A0A9W9FEK2_9EURO|nr:uncharacterized protein N7532_005697 [Penicillium argentinense]KAJ5098696.1 hypothetical protein N7532_005697 [Penicillium argentinense]